MGNIKGCGNELCETHKKKISYRESEAFCSKCGKELVHVCKDCYTKLPDDNDKYCVRCFAKHEDRKEKIKKVATGVGTGALAVAGFTFTYGKKVFDVVKKNKG